jgi:hypothetical protein
MPDQNVQKFRKASQGSNLRITVRPTNPASVKWLERGSIPKPAAIKAKTINEDDVYLGALRENIGLVAYFKPNRPNYEEIPPDRHAAVDERYKQRRREFRELADTMEKLANNQIRKIAST